MRQSFIRQLLDWNGWREELAEEAEVEKRQVRTEEDEPKESEEKT